MSKPQPLGELDLPSNDFQRLVELRSWLAWWNREWDRGHSPVVEDYREWNAEYRAVLRKVALRSVGGCRIRAPGAKPHLTVIDGGQRGA